MSAKQSRWGLAAAVGMGILILDSKTALLGATAGLQLCILSLIPSLFPFFVLSSLLSSALMGTKLPLLGPLRKLLRIPEGCESLLIPGFLGGYPAGAQCIGQALGQERISRTDARRLLLFCNNAGPSFLFGVLGPVFSEKWMLWALWGVQIAAALLCSRILPELPDRTCSMKRTEPSLPDALAAGIRILATVCGWVIFFRVIIAFCERWFLWLLPAALQVAVKGALELANGCCTLVLIADDRLRFVIASGLLSFGGLCVTMQTASVIGNLPLSSYVFSKLLQSLFCLGFSAAIMYRAVWMYPLLGICALCLKKVVAFSGFLMYNDAINLRRNPYAVSKENRTRLHILPVWHSA